MNPLAHRYLKVTQPGLPGDASTGSYQALLALADVPSEGMLFPGSEFIGRLDETGLDVDWAMRLHVRSSAEVSSKNRRALVNLNEQFNQRDGEVSLGLGVLDRAAADLSDYAHALDSDKLEVETQVTLILAVAGPTATDATEQARGLADYLGQAGFRLTQPLGGQEELWWAMQPGVPTSRLVRDLAQITTSRALAASVPMASTELGDRVGALMALNITSGRPSVVLHDIAGAAGRDISGSLAAAGEPGAGKALALDTPVPTPSGWSTIGDLVPGDRVLDESGQPVPVLAVSPVMRQRPCFEVRFSDGSRVVADADHAWTTIPRLKRQSAAKLNYKIKQRAGSLLDLTAQVDALTEPGWHRHATTVTTRDLAGSLLYCGQTNHAIPVAAPLDLPERDLPISPYLLGAWLGDGTSADASITTADPQIAAFIEADGYRVTPLAARYRYGIRMPDEAWFTGQTRACEQCGASVWCRYEHRRYCSQGCAATAARSGATPLPPRVCPRCAAALPRSSTGVLCRSCRSASTVVGRLRALGVWRNKHIPADYLRASIAQRRALLAGLLDTDGTASAGGTVVFSNTSDRLAHDVHELVCSLGYRAALHEKPAMLNGRRIGSCWDVSFTTTADDPVFWVPRKAEAHAQRAAHANPARHRYRYVVDVIPAESVPVRCIQVGNESGLFLIGPSMLPTHNSTLLKSLAGAVVDRGGRIVVPDRTASAEYLKWATSLTDAQVVDVLDPTASMDPLRLFPGLPGARAAQSFLTPLLNVAPTSTQGVLLSEVLDPDYLTHHQVCSLGDLPAHLSTACDLPGAKELARLMNVFARKDVGRVVFDASLPPLNATSRAIIVRTHGVELPTHSEMGNQHLFTQMPVEKVLGRALYALIAALARQWCFADPSQLGAFVVDEAHHVTSSPEGERELIDFIRDGRKHQAAVLLGSHDPEADFGSPTLRGLIPTRVLMRHRDHTLARRGLAWLDLDPTDETLVKLLTEDTSPVGADGVPWHRRGEALLRHPTGVGRIKVLEPSRPDRAAAARTSPPEQTRL